MNTAQTLDLFGEVVVCQPRVFQQHGGQQSSRSNECAQLSLLDLLELPDETLEQVQSFDEELSEDYIEWLRMYVLKHTLRQITHPQVGSSQRREALDWMLSDVVHPFSFSVCCGAWGANFEEVRLGVLRLIRQHLK